ncbi:ATP-grasp domain-containing protein [Hungatella hathewayi]|uniref:ATP-grasp domain-containing protein n=1 Tax=Hungatella hathewayi TaxID=154046 RepID=UPI003567698F
MKALVLCGGMSQICLIKHLKNKGIYTILADMNSNAPAVKYADTFYPISTLDVEGIRKIAISEKVDYIMSVCADQMLFVTAQLSEELGLPCYIDYETAKNVSGKEYMKRIFVEHNIPTARYIVKESLSMDDVAGLQWPLIVKPVDCYSSKGVKKVNNEKELMAAFAEAISYSRTNTAVIEQYVDGEELSVDYYIENGEAKLLCARVLDKIPEGNGFIICRGKYPAPLTEEMYTEVVGIGQKIANAFCLTNTPMLVQMKVNGDNIKVIEFCSRTGGGIKYRLIPRVTGFDVVKAVLDLTLGDKPHYGGFHLNKYIIDEFLYCKPGTLDHLEGFKELLDEGVIVHYDQFKANGSAFKAIESSGSRVAYFSVEADTLVELKQKQRIAGERVKAISTTGEDLIRHDIIQFIPY